jgi:hypothetical protein
MAFAYAAFAPDPLARLVLVVLAATNKLSGHYRPFDGLSPTDHKSNEQAVAAFATDDLERCYCEQVNPQSVFEFDTDTKQFSRTSLVGNFPSSSCTAIEAIDWISVEGRLS